MATNEFEKFTMLKLCEIMKSEISGVVKKIICDFI